MSYENMSSQITRPAADNHYALLFVGVCNRQRYVKSLIRWTNLLHEMYGYPLTNIRILVGTYSNSSWSSMVAGTDVTYDATQNDLDNALAAYAAGSGDPNELGTNDNLFIFSFNHGGQDGNGCYLCCENYSTKYYASDFGSRINAIHCRQIVLLAAQCHSGGFVDPFINSLWSGTQGAVMAGCRSDQNTYEAVFDKLFASAFNGRMIQNALDDNIDLGITGDGTGITTVPGYHTNRIDWGPTGVLSTREAFNWVYDHYCSEIWPNYASIPEVPLYRQKPWIDAGKPVQIQLGEPDLVMQDCTIDTGVEPSPCTNPWFSPDLCPDNTDQFPGVGQYEYVPEHHNRFFVRTANRGTAPTDNIWRILEVRGLGFTGGPVGPPRIDKAVETSGTDNLSARLRPGRAQTQYHRIMMGGDFGHGCISAAAFCNTDELSHNLWSIKADNDQVQCNLNPASVSGSVPVSSTSTNANAGKLIRTIPILAEQGGTFRLNVGKSEEGLPLKVSVKNRTLKLRKGQQGKMILEIMVGERVKDGVKDRLSATILRNRETIGGMTFLLETATAYAQFYVYDVRGLGAPMEKIILHQPGDPRELYAKTNKKGIAEFGPLNPGFYFAEIEKGGSGPTRVHIRRGKENRFKLFCDRKPRQIRKKK